MYTPLDLKTRYTNLNNNLLKELKRYYLKNNIPEPARPSGEVYFEELKLIQRLELNFSGIISFNIGDKPFASYLTGLKKLTIKSPCRVPEDFLKDIPNKEQLTDLTIIGTDYVNIDLSGFSNLEFLELSRNDNLRTINGLDKLKKVLSLTFYSNQQVDEEQACKFIVDAMRRNADLNIDILYYKRITALIRKEYSEHRDSFREAKWIEAIDAGLEKNRTIEHSTIETGLFYSRLDDILNEIIPRTGVDELEAIFLIYSWIVQNVSYDHVGLKNKLKMHSFETELNFNGKIQKIRMSTGKIGGTNGAFNAIYGKSVVCQGFTKVMQMFLKAYDYDIKTYDEDAYGEADPNKKIIPLKQLASRGSSPINHSILRIVLDNQSFFCDATNERKDENGNVLQTKFMKTFEELTTRWYPVSCSYPGKAIPLTDEEREQLSKARIRHNIPYNYEAKAVRMMEKFDLHITDETDDLIIETQIKKVQAEDLLLLGIINSEVLRIIQNQQSTEYLNICAEKTARKK